MDNESAAAWAELEAIVVSHEYDPFENTLRATLVAGVGTSCFRHFGLLF